MKKILIALLLFIPVALFATDFGLTIENTTSVYTDPNNIFMQKDKATLWVTLDLAEHISFNIEAFYKFNIQEPMHTFAVDLFEFKADFPVIGENSFLFGFSLGRFIMADFTNFVLTHPVDGVKLVYRNAFLNSALAAGFTGLLLKGESTLVMSIEDKNYSPSLLPLVPPRLIGMLSLNFPECFLYQTLDIAVIGQLDMQADSEVLPEGAPPSGFPDYSNGGKIDTLYAGLGLSGPLFPQFYWELYFYFEFGRTLSFYDGAYHYSPIYAFLSGFKFDWYFPEALKSKLSLQVIIASGDGDYENYLEGNTDAYSLQFIPITRPTIGLVFAQQLTNIILAQLEFSMKPFIGDKPSVWDNFQMSFLATGFFRASRSDISDSRGLNSGSLDYYLGSEIDVITNFKPASDLGLQLALGLFLPNNYTSDSAFAPDARLVEFLARFQLVFEL